MIVAQISDTHIDLDDPNGAARCRNLERCVAAINRLEPRPDAVIHTGDLSHNAKPAEYEAAKRILLDLRMPLYVTAGNRDDRALIRAAFPAERYLLPATPFVQFSVDDHPVRLIAVDTLGDNTNQGEFCRIRADNLRAALAGSAAKPTVVFLHHPPFEVRESDYPVQFASWEGVERMERALAGQAHVVAVFCGHTHRDAAGRIGGVTVSSTPSVAVDKRLGRYPARFDGVPIFKLHRVDGERGVVSEILAA